MTQAYCPYSDAFAEMLPKVLVRSDPDQDRKQRHSESRFPRKGTGDCTQNPVEMENKHHDRLLSLPAVSGYEVTRQMFFIVI